MVFSNFLEFYGKVLINTIDQYFVSVLRNPNNVVLTGVDTVVLTSEFHNNHFTTQKKIQETTSSPDLRLGFQVWNI